MKKLLSLLLALCMIVSLAACGGGDSGEESSDNGGTETAVIKVGGIGPTTGPNAQYGEGVRNGMELAAKEINAQGGLQFEIRFEDDVSETENAVNAYNILKDWGIQILLGTVTSTPCIAVAEETYNDNLFQLTPSGTAVECVQYDNAFRVCFSDPNQGAMAAQYIGENGLAAKVGVIYDSSNTYSQGIYESFAAEAENQGFEIVAAEAFTKDTNTDFSVQVKKLQSAGAELMFLPIYYSEAISILSYADTIGYSPIVFGCDGLDGILSAENFDTSLAEGVMLLTPYVPGSNDITTEFTEKYIADYGIEPNQFAADAYDGMYAIAAACEHAGVTPDMSASDICDLLKTAFTEITVEGVTGTITWEASGEPNKEPKAVVISDGVYVDPNSVA